MPNDTLRIRIPGICLRCDWYQGLGSSSWGYYNSDYSDMMYQQYGWGYDDDANSFMATNDYSNMYVLGDCMAEAWSQGVVVLGKTTGPATQVELIIPTY